MIGINNKLYLIINKLKNKLIFLSRTNKIYYLKLNFISFNMECSTKDHPIN